VGVEDDVRQSTLLSCVPGEDNRGTGDWFWSGPEAEDVAFSHSLKLVIPKNTMEKK
jgi:hypothetical protein